MRGDLVIGSPFGDQREHFGFARSEGVREDFGDAVAGSRGELDEALLDLGPRCVPPACTVRMALARVSASVTLVR